MRVLAGALGSAGVPTLLEALIHAASVAFPTRLPSRHSSVSPKAVEGVQPVEVPCETHLFLNTVKSRYDLYLKMARRGFPKAGATLPPLQPFVPAHTFALAYGLATSSLIQH